jgi:hypothetical protein
VVKVPSQTRIRDIALRNPFFMLNSKLTICKFQRASLADGRWSTRIICGTIGIVSRPARVLGTRSTDRVFFRNPSSLVGALLAHEFLIDNCSDKTVAFRIAAR